MSKKAQKISTVEILDTFIPIFTVCWVMIFSYISLFNESSTLAFITIVPIFFLFGLYMIGSSIYCYKELEILKAFEKDTTEIEKKNRKRAPKLSKTKLIIGVCCIAVGIMFCIIL